MQIIAPKDEFKPEKHSPMSVHKQNSIKSINLMFVWLYCTCIGLERSRELCVVCVVFAVVGDRQLLRTGNAD